MKCRNEGEFAVKIETLREIILESMRVFWEFLCADKDEFSSVMKVSHQTQVSPQDPLDLELLTEMRTNLQKVFFLTLLIHFVISHQLFLYTQDHVLGLYAEGEEIKGDTEKPKLHSEEVEEE